MIKYIEEIGDLSDKKVVLRLDLNVPIENKEVRDAFRIEKSIPTLNFLLKNNAKVVVLAHIESEEKTLLPVYEYMKKQIPNLVFAKNIDDVKIKLKEASPGTAILMENIRQYEGEKKNDPQFAKELAQLGQIYVNEGFSVSHRPHASVVGIAKNLPCYAGNLFRNEVENLKKAFSPSHPFLFILGGAKFETKIPLIEKFIDIADKIFVGGALACDIIKSKGLNVGSSLVSKFSDEAEAKEKLLKIANNPKILLPMDFVVCGKDGDKLVLPNEISSDQRVVDIGGESSKLLNLLIQTSKTILWNGPMGNYENGYIDGTIHIAEALSRTNAFSIVGGGDTLAVMSKVKATNNISFLSTGGGAMLDFLAKGTLPGIEALDIW